MKLKTWFVTAAAVLSGMLYAESVSIPVLYRNPAEEVKPGQLQAFGFYENQTRIVLAFQISGLQDLIAKPKSYLGFYADVDDDLETGRFRKAHGWDFQINMILTRKAVLSMIKWNGDKEKAQELSRRGCAVSASGDMLYVTIPKSSLAGLEFKPQFKIRMLQLRYNQRVDQQKPLGLFPEKFELPAE